MTYETIYEFFTFMYPFCFFLTLFYYLFTLLLPIRSIFITNQSNSLNYPNSEWFSEQKCSSKHFLSVINCLFRVLLWSACPACLTPPCVVHALHALVPYVPCVYLVRLICPRALVSSCLTCHTWLTYPTWLACLTYTACVTCPYSLVQSE